MCCHLERAASWVVHGGRLKGCSLERADESSPGVTFLRAFWVEEAVEGGHLAGRGRGDDEG